MQQQCGLILEGGGLRGLYTSGVLDALMDCELEFPSVLGVSAGVLNALSFISHQKGRSRDINITYINDKRYFGAGNLIRTGSIFGAEMMFHLIPDIYMPFDYDTYEASPCTLTAVVTDCETGQAAYYPVKDLKNNYDIVRATSSLPFVSKIVEYDGGKLLDGGLTDSIPIKQSIKMGFEKNVVVLTQHREYRKTPPKQPLFVQRYYRNYPNLSEAILNRYKMYNDTLEEIDLLEKEKKIFVIRPRQPLGLKRFEKDTGKLRRAYDWGYDNTIQVIDDLKAFLVCNPIMN